jgi:uncharacterized membrane protein YedE/YeeE
VVRVAITLAMFSVLPIAYTIWPSRGGSRHPLRSYIWFFFFVYLAVVLLGLNSYRHQLESWLNTHALLERLMEVGGGWLLPLLMLVVFGAFWLWRLRHRRSP